MQRQGEKLHVVHSNLEFPIRLQETELLLLIMFFDNIFVGLPPQSPNQDNFFDGR